MIDPVDHFEFWVEEEEEGRFHLFLKLFLFEIVEFGFFIVTSTHVIDQFLRHNLGLIFCLEANSEQGAGLSVSVGSSSPCRDLSWEKTRNYRSDLRDKCPFTNRRHRQALLKASVLLLVESAYVCIHNMYVLTHYRVGKSIFKPDFPLNSRENF